MTDIKEKIKTPAAVWHWSFRPGTFLDKDNGKELYKDIAGFSWRGTIHEWNLNLVSICKDLAKEIGSKGREKVYISKSLYPKIFSAIEVWFPEIEKSNQIDHNKVCIISEDGKVGLIEVSNINEKGNII